MAAEEDRKSYIILRDDGLLLHTKPVTRWEAVWLMAGAYKEVLDLDLRARYLEEWGNVLDVSDCAERLWDLGLGEYHNIKSIYEGPEEFVERVRSLLERGDVSPGARQVIEELLSRAGEFLRRPVEPKPIGPRPVRYFEMPDMHVIPGPGGADRTVPEAKWYAKVMHDNFRQSGISVFDDAIWFWGQIQVAPRRLSAWRGLIQPKGVVWAVAVRRDARDGDVVAALANDEAAQGFLVKGAEHFRGIINAHRTELEEKGYEDVVRKAEIVLGAVALLAAGRWKEATPA